MTGNKIGLSGLSIIVPSLEHNKSLKTLNLAYNEIEEGMVGGHDPLKTLCINAALHKSMILLNLSGNFFTENGYQSILIGLQTRKDAVTEIGNMPPSFRIKVAERVKNEFYSQIHSMNQALSGGKK